MLVKIIDFMEWFLTSKALFRTTVAIAFLTSFVRRLCEAWE